MREEIDEEKEIPDQKEMSQEVNDIKEKMMEGQTTKTLTKEEIQAALEERHSPEIAEKTYLPDMLTIAGLGGLGSNVAYALARIGVGHLHLIDFDVVDITNLNRQQYFMEHLGMYKTDALKSLLLKINPYLDIRTDCVKVTEENLSALFEDAGYCMRSVR